jgi:predicted Ser/Thr protein kinase
VTLHERALIAGRYRVERRIGAGGMGSVYLATDIEDGRAVALKRAHEGRRPADREIQIAHHLRHPRIVALYDSIVADGERWLVMEYVPSRDLAAVVAAEGALPVDRAARIGRQIAEALQALHAAGVVHGDVAPGNVLVTGDGDAKLADFGVARAIWSDATVTAGALVAGTPAYLAPEVARGGERTPASDIFSLGATLFTAVEGVSPLGDAPNPLTAVWRSASGHVSAPTAGPLASALATMLRVDPGERPDAAEARRLLEHSGPAMSRRSRPRAVRAAAAAVGVAAAVAVGCVVAFGHVLDRTGPHQRQGTPPPATVGDPRTADLCALISTGALSAFGSPRLVADYGNFNRCDVLVSKGGRDFADAKVTIESGPPPDFDARASRQIQGSITTVSEPASGDACDEFLLLRDGNFAVVTVRLLSPGSLDVCAAATAEARYAATVLDHTQIPRRRAPWPATSLANVDACSLLDPATLARTPGFGPVAPAPGLGHWVCDWDARSARLSARVQFDRNTELNAEDGQPVRLGGRQAFVTPDGDGPGTCVVSIVYRPYRSAEGERKEETTEVVVTGGRPRAELCADATTLAPVVATRLPHV